MNKPIQQKILKYHTIIGYVLRIFVIIALVYGMTLFICDAIILDINSINILAIVLIACIPVIIMGISKKCFYISGLIMLILWIYSAFRIKTPLIFIKTVYKMLYDVVSKRFSYNLFGTITENDIDSLFNTQIILFTVVYITALILVSICVLSMNRKVRIIPLTLMVTSVLVPIFMFNLSISSWGFSIIVSALCGIIALKIQEHKFHQKKITFAEAALGGFTSASIMIISFALLFVPTYYIHLPWETMTGIYDIINEGRALLSSRLSDGISKNSDIGILGKNGVGFNLETLGKRNTKASERIYNSKVVLRVKSYCNFPIYLRSWIGSDYLDDNWEIPSAENISEYYKLFGNDFSSEKITKKFYSEKITNLSDIKRTYNSYTDMTEYGLTITPIDIEIINSSGYLLYMPVVYDSEIGLLSEGGFKDNPYPEGYGKYWEGIVITGRYNFFKTYRVLAYILRNSNKNIVSNINSYIDKYKTDEINKLYTEYVYKTYTDINEIDKEILERYIAENLNDITIHEPKNFIDINNIVMSVIDCLKKNNKYSLSPREATEKGLCAIEEFLFDTKEGYCVQFATAASLILREMGIPTRYAEGYIANDFKKIKSNSEIYISNVYDYNAHAWMEVYVDPIGWVLYETTPEYYNDIYNDKQTEDEIANGTQETSYDSVESDEVIKFFEKKANDDKIKSREIKAIIFMSASSIICLLLCTVLLLLIYHIIKSSTEVKRTNKLIATATNGNLSDVEILATARKINDKLELVYKTNGFIPKLGEYPEEFAERIYSSKLISDLIYDIRDVNLISQKAEFSPSIQKDELKILGMFLNDITVKTYSKMDFRKRFWFRIIKRML